MCQMALGMLVLCLIMIIGKNYFGTSSYVPTAISGFVTDYGKLYWKNRRRILSNFFIVQSLKLNKIGAHLPDIYCFSLCIMSMIKPRLAFYPEYGLYEYMHG